MKSYEVKISILKKKPFSIGVGGGVLDFDVNNTPLND